MATPSFPPRTPVIFLLLSCPFLLQPAGAAPAPLTIPAVQQWTIGTGTCAFGPTSCIVINNSDAATLGADAQTFANDLCGLLGRAITIKAAASPADGDIFMKLGATSPSIGDEGYQLTITTSFEISAKTPAGVFYATRTLLQLFRQSTTVNQGSIVDWPEGRWRGQMVDVGRKYYTVAWLQTLIRDMAYVKMNLFHFHLSDGISKTDNGGFRLECSSHPEITSAQHYTNAEIQSLIALAAQYHITILPEIDFPGHTNWLYPTHHKNVLLTTKVLGSQYWALDLSKDSSYALVKDLLDELVPLFPGPFWHLGADEYMFIDEYATFPQLTTWAKAKFGAGAHANDCYRYFVNWANELLKSKGKTMWAWNDVLLGITGQSVGLDTLARDIVMDHWGALNWIGWGGVYPDAERDRGYKMMNCSWDLFYIITSNAKSTGNPQWAYDSWELKTFAGGNLSAGDTNIVGGKVPVWGDMPAAETETQVWSNTFMLSRAVAQKCWGSPKIQATYANFQTLANSLGRAPAPVVSTIKPSRIKSRLLHRDPKTVELFDLRGVRVQTLPGKGFSSETVCGATFQRSAKNARLNSGPYLIRIRGRGFDKTFLTVIR
jgi:hexosaminidase